MTIMLVMVVSFSYVLVRILLINLPTIFNHNVEGEGGGEGALCALECPALSLFYYNVIVTSEK